MSPVLANLFMHYAFDMWLTRTHPEVVFERYADDAIVHCDSEAQARDVLAGIAERMTQVGLTLHPDKTQILYGKDANRSGRYERTAFTFLGYTFRPRPARDRKGPHVPGVPARNQPASPEEDQPARPSMAAAPLDLPHLRRDSPHDQPGRRGLDAVLRAVLPVGAVSPPGVASTPTWCAGSATSTDATTRPAPRAPSSRKSPPGIPACSGTGAGSRPPTDQGDKPGDLRSPAFSGQQGARRVRTVPARRRPTSAGRGGDP